ncbi:DUF1127 domain-containing protein [Pseudooceanicola sp.]|uniref:DUF1127 domain-containing protein n=1 Tax=Pseudooceanicola sp. TaxID=1914328 RepID=UPI0035C6B555
MFTIRLIQTAGRPGRPSLLRLLLAAMREHRRLKRDAAALRRLPDYLLDDIGLTRDGRRR